MNNTVSEVQIRLRKGALWTALKPGAALLVRCADGLVWVTEQNDSRDIVLRAGQQFVVESDGLVAVQALTDAAIITTRRKKV
ncbi:MAG TPA: DUF2917 domain-containing protein [Verrucomicrobiae bacterium]|nr:DUF2917 domain-containing protein [Verrucomicrobiae bacterium]